MWVSELQLIWMLVVILGASILFTNALEHLGDRLGISQGVVGSIFAAVATALPEAMIPFIALLAGGSTPSANHAVSAGAILGAPLMISTLSTALMAIFAFSGRGFTGRIKPEKSGIIRDLNFFLIAYLLSAVAMYLPYQPLYWRSSCSLFLLGLYGLYVKRTFKASKRLIQEGHGMILEDPLLLSRFLLPTNMTTISCQLLLGFMLLLWSAREFVLGIETISQGYQVSTLLLSLLIIPIATELPEKVNSILWIRKRKDTLAFGNLTGAMVFQGTLLPALGILLSCWQPHPEVFTSMVVTIIAAAWLRFHADFTRGLPILALLFNGLLYLLYLYWSFYK